MKVTFLYVLGLFLALMAFTAGRSAASHGWDFIELGIAALFLFGAISAFKAGAKILDGSKR